MHLKKIKTSISMALTIVILGVPVLNTVSAMERQDINSMYSVSINNSENSIDFSNVEDLTDFKYANVEEGFTVEISDDVVIKRLAESGYDVSEANKNNNNTRMLRSAKASRGVTKFVKVSGGWNLYISSTLANIIIKGGGGAAGVLMTAIPGIGWSVAGVLAGIITNQISTDLATFGIVFRYRSNTGKITYSKQ